MSKGIVIHPDGRTERRDFPDLKSMQDAVGGHIELVTPDRTLGRADMFVNEEGAIKELPINLAASRIWIHGNSGQALRGPAIVLGPADSEGDNTDLPAVTARRIMAVINSTGPCLN